MGIIPNIGVTTHKSYFEDGRDAYEYDGKYYENYDDIPFATKQAYETGAKLAGDTVQTILDKPGVGHLLRGAAWVAGKGFQYLDKEAGGAYSTMLGLADKGITKAADVVEYHTGLYSPTAKLGGELAIDYALSGGVGKTIKTGKHLASQADNLLTTTAKTIFPQPQYAYATVLADDHLIKNVLKDRLSDSSSTFKPSTMFAITGTRNLDRVSGSAVLGGQNKEARVWYKKLQNRVETDGRIIARTSTHHRNQLMQQAKAIADHPNGDAILRSLRDKGIPVGDDITNYTAILDINPKHLRIAKVDEAIKLYPDIPRKTIDDAFGASDLDLQDLTIKERDQFELLRSKTDITPEEFFSSLKRQGKYPTIDLFNPDGSKITWKPKTFEEWNKRWQKINEHYGTNIDPKKLSNIKVNPELATYGPDHKFLHNEVLNNLPSHKRLAKLQKSGEWKNLSEAEAFTLLEQVSQDSIKASNQVSKFRYWKIAEYYDKFKLNSKIPDKFKKIKWNKLPTDIQKQYFQENASKLSSYGSRDLTISNMKKMKALTNKEKAFFGIK